MNGQVAHKVDVAAVAQAQAPLDQQQRQIESDAVEAIDGVVVGEQSFRIAQNVLDVGFGDAAMRRLIPADAVVVQHGDADGGERQAQGQQRERAAARRRGAAARQRDEGGGVHGNGTSAFQSWPAPRTNWPVRTRATG